jgi:hypothetical protein
VTSSTALQWWFLASRHPLLVHGLHTPTLHRVHTASLRHAIRRCFCSMFWALDSVCNENPISVDIFILRLFGFPWKLVKLQVYRSFHTPDGFTHHRGQRLLLAACILKWLPPSCFLLVHWGASSLTRLGFSVVSLMYLYMCVYIYKTIIISSRG